MNSSSDDENSEMEIRDDGSWMKLRHKKERNRDPNSPTEFNRNKKLSSIITTTMDSTHMIKIRTYNINFLFESLPKM